MRRFILGLALLILFTLPSAAQAQGTVDIDQMNVKIWPEYDQPGVLVIENFFLSSKVYLPAKVSLTIPESAGDLHSLAFRDVDGMLYYLDYEKSQTDHRIMLTFTTPVPEIWLEYYDSNLLMDGFKRNYTYRWQGDFSVNDFTVEIQQPAAAESFNIVEGNGTGSTGSDGLTYYNLNLGKINAGSGFMLHLNYENPDSVLTDPEQLAVRAISPLPEVFTDSLTIDIILPWVLAGVGLMLIGGSIFWYRRSGRDKFQLEKGHKFLTHLHSAKNSESLIYCSQCGNRVNSGDVFCRTCGIRLRRE